MKWRNNTNSGIDKFDGPVLSMATIYYYYILCCGCSLEHIRPKRMRRRRTTSTTSSTATRTQTIQRQWHEINMTLRGGSDGWMAPLHGLSAGSDDLYFLAEKSIKPFWHTKISINNCPFRSRFFPSLGPLYSFIIIIMPTADSATDDDAKEEAHNKEHLFSATHQSNSFCFCSSF